MSIEHGERAPADRPEDRLTRAAHIATIAGTILTAIGTILAIVMLFK